MSSPTNQSFSNQDHPTQPAFLPISGSETWGFITVAAVFLVLFLLGLVLDWQNITAWGYFDANRANNLERAIILEFVVELLLTYAYWVFLLPLPFLVYFGWRKWRKNRRFLLHKQPAAGVVTHLWIDPPRPPGRKYFVGFQFGAGFSAYQSVNPQRYKRLSIGDPINLEFVPGEPDLVALDFSQSKRKTPTA